ncbi:hypothetical protein HD806DRAFT_517368 [Xylariaceae sp. AK1471]|nr:hypothetical protein HD806DRAFT_517368 [Xylariaceae sp. AK1471]
MSKSIPDEIGDGPAGLLPRVTTSDFDDPQAKVSSFVLLGIFVTLMLLAVFIRVFVRIRFTKSWKWDDYTCILAAIGSLAHTILYSQFPDNSPSRLIRPTSFPAAVEALGNQVSSVNGIPYQVTICFAKVSILLLYLRIFGVNRILRLSVYTSIIILILFYTSVTGIAIGYLVKCTNAESLLSESLFICTSYQPWILSNASFNVVTDFWILLLPFPLVSKLQLCLRQKLGFAAVFAAGLGACAASLARLVKIVNVFQSAQLEGNIAQFSILEINIAIIVACTSCFPAFFTHAKHWLRAICASNHIPDDCPKPSDCPTEREAS